MLTKNAKLVEQPNLHRMVRLPAHHGAGAPKERLVRDGLLGRPQSPRSLGLGFRLLRANQSTDFSEKEAVAIEAGDAITTIVPVAGGAPTVPDV